jgi:hypothetical protein
MLFAAHHLPSLHVPTLGAALRVLGGGLALLACLCEARAQVPAAWAAHLDGALLANRSDEPVALPTYEFTTVRGHLPAPLAHLDRRATSDLAGVSYRVWMSRGLAEVGVGVGTLGYVLPSADGRGDGPRGLVGAVPTLTLGLRYRMTNTHMVFADATGVRGLGADPALASYMTKVGVEWKPARSSLGLEHGAVGLHLDSGYRLSLKPRRGGAALYLRSQF